ncbi:unnamed protein product [Vicia faba]|uniref:Uncharacterized protein n=1 Tax=Vicia faba TaxID=3906 RepID=A0AAV1BCB0_VICFA|nr:unnamed protein product [Vicia faba]
MDENSNIIQALCHMEAMKKHKAWLGDMAPEATLLCLLSKASTHPPKDIAMFSSGVAENLTQAVAAEIDAHSGMDLVGVEGVCRIRQSGTRAVSVVGDRLGDDSRWLLRMVLREI